MADTNRNQGEAIGLLEVFGTFFKVIKHEGVVEGGTGALHTKESSD